MISFWFIKLMDEFKRVWHIFPLRISVYIITIIGVHIEIL